MIPKTIHYCWFGGGKKPKQVIKCIDSWKKNCPDFKIFEWNESNTDLAMNGYVSQAFEQKKWAFLTDYLRLKIIFEHGGIYLDTDVEIIKTMDDLLLQNFFLGCESEGVIATGLGFGAIPNCTVIGTMLEEYEKRFLYNRNTPIEFIACPELNTYAVKHLMEKNDRIGLEIIEFCGGKIYPPEYFCPYNYHSKVLNLTSKTYSIHHYYGSWLSPYVRTKSNIIGFFRRTFFKRKWRI